jgi:hypothetical protein
VNGYVAGGWGAAAAIIILYSWRTVRRGRILARSLPEKPPQKLPPNQLDEPSYSSPEGDTGRPHLTAAATAGDSGLEQGTDRGWDTDRGQPWR